jgi:hypothetical protein
MKDQQRAKFAIKDISCYNLKNEKVRDFVDTTEAANWILENGYSNGSMEAVLKQIKLALGGRTKSAYGFI